MDAGDEVEVAPMITGAVDLVSMPGAFEPLTCLGGRVTTLVRPARA